jgi:heat shock protein HtpX
VGRGPLHWAITVTRGLLQSLQDDVIEAVLRHELTHMVNRDVRLLIISIIYTGMIGFCITTCMALHSV